MHTPLINQIKSVPALSGETCLPVFTPSVVFFLPSVFWKPVAGLIKLSANMRKMWRFAQCTHAQTTAEEARPRSGGPRRRRDKEMKSDSEFGQNEPKPRNKEAAHESSSSYFPPLTLRKEEGGSQTQTNPCFKKYIFIIKQIHLKKWQIELKESFTWKRAAELFQR